jgi:hypothetical protein
VRLLLGYCGLVRGSRAVALEEITRSLGETADVVPVGLRREALGYLVDAVLDLDEWGFVREHPGLFSCPRPAQEPEAQITLARAQALMAQVEERSDEAEGLLRSCLETARSLDAPLLLARYLHHLALVLLNSNTSREEGRVFVEAAELLAEELGVLPTPGVGYFRARALLMRSIALTASGQARAAAADLSEAIDLARSIQALAVLAKGLRERAGIQMKSEG